MTDQRQALEHLRMIAPMLEDVEAERSELLLQRDAWASLARMHGASLGDIARAAGVSPQRVQQWSQRWEVKR